MVPSHRRDVLRGIAAGGLASVAGLAGCTQLQSEDEEQADRPSYHPYVPVEGSDSEGAFFIALDFERFREFESNDVEKALPEEASVNLENGSGIEDADPMLAYPAVGLLVGVLALSFGLVPYGFASDVTGGFASGGLSGETPTPTDGGQPTETEGPAQVDTAVMLDSAFVFEGSFEPAAIGEAAEGFERTDERDGLAVYEGTEGESLVDTSNLAFAVGEELLVALFGQDDDDDPRATLDPVLDVAAGDADRLSGIDGADWTLRNAGHGLVAIGGWGVDPETAGTSQAEGGVEVDSALEGARGLVSSLAVPEGDTRADIAAVFPEGEAPDSEQLESELGTSADDREIEVDDSRVSATATWSTGSGTDTP